MTRAAPDTIAAIATARGAAALAVVRLSGPEAAAVAQRCLRRPALGAMPSHTLRADYVVDAAGAALDQVVVAVFRAPHSATGEEVVEVTCHGGEAASRAVLARLLAEGARPAEPGEFTRRAFLNGKLDLAQAEAVADLIHASSAAAHRVSMAHLQGRYSDRLQSLRRALLDACALVELELDFAEEDAGFLDRAHLAGLLREAGGVLEALLGSWRTGRRVRDGVHVAIAGRPNVGKSTLLNALVGRPRAIVSPTPGATRDTVEAEVEIAGMRYLFADTAGLRETVDPIEREGVQRALAAAQSADVLLYVFDASEGLTPEESGRLAAWEAEEGGPALLLVGNKADLAPAADAAGALRISAHAALAEPRLLAPLLEAVQAAAGANLGGMDAAHTVVNERHYHLLVEARRAAAEALASVEAGAGGEVTALHLREGLHALGAITGEVTTEDVLGQIFSRFCIGK